MYTTSNSRSNRLKIAYLLLAIFAGTSQIYAQNEFSSGSTGADGAFAPTTNQTLQVPESGVFNFTTVNIPTGVTVKFLRNSRNTPVTLLATGNITIVGSIGVNGEIGFATGAGGRGGPGGYAGGDGGVNVDFFGGKTGDGPGGGTGGNNANNDSAYRGGGGGGYGSAGGNASSVVAPYGQGGSIYGTYSLLPLFGGSGGGGGAAPASNHGGSGGGGGGAILIASSGTISLTGSVTAIGGNSGSFPAGGAGGGGSGGAVRLIANIISGAGGIDVRGGYTGGWTYSGVAGGQGGRGHIRAEAYDYSTFNPNVYSVPINITLPNPISVPNAAQLQIISIAGATVPLVTRGSLFGTPDLVLPGSLTNPVAIQIQATNVPVDSVVQVTVTPASGARTTFQSTPLSGSASTSTASASINLPAGVSVVTVSLTIDLQVAKLQPMFIDGEKITHMEIASILGGRSETTYVTKTGKRVKLSELVQ